MKAHIFKATCVVLLSLARLPEILLKTQPALLHLSLLLCDAGSQCRVEIRQLGPAHVQHLPHTGLQVRQGRLLRRAFEVCKLFPTMICPAMSRSSLSPTWSGSSEADGFFLWKTRGTVNESNANTPEKDN